MVQIQQNSSGRRLPLRRFRVLACLFLWMVIVGQASAEERKLETCLETAETPLDKMECFRGLPYRVDGALDEHGRWTFWADPDKETASVGLNCSGFVAAASRSIWGQTFSLEAAKNDRLNDSGPEAPMGEDWDFGLDLILNLTDELPRQLIPNPYEYQDVDSHLWNAVDLRGVNIDSMAFPDMLAQLRHGRIYYFAISRPDRKFKGGISFYHVGIILREKSAIWMYHATAKAGVSRVNLAGERGVAWFRRYYGASPRGPKHIQLIEVTLTNSVVN